MARKSETRIDKFTWSIDKLNAYLPDDWRDQEINFLRSLNKFCHSKYHDEPDCYAPFEKLLKGLFSFKKSPNNRISSELQYLRNRNPKSFANSKECPDFIFGKDENVFFELKNREDLDKINTSRGKSPHKQIQDYLKACQGDAFGILCNLETFRFYLKAGEAVKVSKDLKIDEAQQNGLCVVLFTIFSESSAFRASKDVRALLPFVASKDGDLLTKEVVEILVETYIKMSRLASPSEDHICRLLICRIAFIFVAESRGIVEKGLSVRILDDMKWSPRAYLQFFDMFNRGSKKNNIPKFNGKLFHLRGEKTIGSRTISELYNGIKRVNHLLNSTNAEINDEIPGSILETLYSADHNSEKIKLSSICDDAQKRITDRMENGTFYTGKLISELAADALVGDQQFDFMPSIMDLCAGSGSLLLPCIRKLAMQISRKKGLSFYDALENVIANNLWAVDKDKTAIELIRLNLAIETARFGTPLIDSSQHLIRADALGSIDAPMGSFDLCISNPPYLLWEKLTSEQSELDGESLKTGSELFSSSSKPDLWYFFLEKALKLVKIGGRVGLVVSDTWISSGRGADVRKLFENTLTLEKVIHFGYPLFPGSSSCPSILIIRKEEPDANHQVIIESYRSESKRQTTNAILRKTPVNRWLLSQSELTQWLEKCIPFAGDLEAKRSRYQTDRLPKFKEIGLEVTEFRLQGKVNKSSIKKSSRRRSDIPVMAGRDFGKNMGFIAASKVPESWLTVGNPAILVQRKGPFINTTVVDKCPAPFVGLTVVGCAKRLPLKVLKELNTYLNSDDFRKWYMMRYSTTWTQGGYLFLNTFMSDYPCPRDIAEKILKITKTEKILKAA
ncbi:MAG: N-6 DNA methylase [Bdellovibrionaceae bacterium]|nr:N-6 DNA methylase [Pseudobdellovibrionaceae bacterium]